MKKRKIIAITCSFALAITIGLIKFGSQGSSDTSLTKQGEILGKYYRNNQLQKRLRKTSKDRNIYAKGKTIVIYEDEFESIKKVYEVYGYKNVEKTALEYLTKDILMNKKAKEEGYTVNEEEVNEYIKKMKREMSKPEFEKQFNELASGFGSTDNYWKYATELARNDLVTKKYLDNLEKNYSKELKMTQSDPEFQEKWSVKLENIKNEMVKKENIKIIK